eukprot:4271216-Pleurochrysis_carterae.AAC.2
MNLSTSSDAMHRSVQHSRQKMLGTGDVNHINVMLYSNIGPAYSYSPSRSQTHSAHVYEEQHPVAWKHHRVKDDTKQFVEKALHLHDGMLPTKQLHCAFCVLHLGAPGNDTGFSAEMEDRRRKITIWLQPCEGQFVGKMHAPFARDW